MLSTQSKRNSRFIHKVTTMFGATATDRRSFFGRRRPHEMISNITEDQFRDDNVM